MSYNCVEDIAMGVVSMFRPPERLTVAEAAEKYRYLKNAGAYQGKWKNSKVPYLVEPMNTLDSRFYETMAFVGPAQSGKTDALILNWTAYSIKADPMDMIIYSPSTAASRDFSMRRIDRLNLHSKDIGSLLLKKRDADNKFDKHYTNGMMLTMSWPSVGEMSGKPVPHVALTDYDRMDDDIGGDGNAFDLASKRTTTFGSFKMALAESSPSKPVTNTRWIANTPHEAPPADGILALYNRGDRRRWYWPCPHCGEYFEGRFTHLKWTPHPDPLTASETVYLECPHCKDAIQPDDRYEMQQWGVWVRDGESVDRNGKKYGTPRRTIMASFWLNGVAAAFATWAHLVRTYITAEEEYRNTGSEESLKKFYNTDLGEPYIPKAVDTDLLPEHLLARAEDLGEKVVPFGVRMLLAQVDVQKNMFIVQVHGILPGNPYDIVIVDRFKIQLSDRVDEDTGEVFWLKPASYLGDWEKLITDVMDKTYPLADGSGRRMAIKLTTCDSGGYSKMKGQSVTSMAYDFYRRLRADGLHGRFHLVKGEGKPGIPRARVTHPDASKKDKLSTARGDVPVLILNSNVLKDAAFARLDCVVPGQGMIRFPNWLPDWFYQELCAEFRTTKGWECRPHARNEAWDLLYYLLGVGASQLLHIEKLDWNSPPTWAADWEVNTMISEPDAPKRFAPPTAPTYDFAKLASRIA